MIKALELPTDVNLAGFSRYLASRGVQHRISEEGTNQVLWVPREEEVDLVHAIYTQYRSGNVEPPGPVTELSGQGVAIGERIFNTAVRFPLTLGLIVVNLMLFPVSFGVDEGDFGGLLRMMTFLAIEQHEGELYFMTFEAVSYTHLTLPTILRV